MFEPRPYQAKILENLSNHWDLRTQLVIAPTGSGKTPTGLQGAKDFVEQYGPDLMGTRNIGVAWMSHRYELGEQAAKENGGANGWDLTEKDLEKSIRVGCPNLEIISLYANPEGLKKRLSRYDEVLLVADEAHHSACVSAVNIMEVLGIKYVLGLSATPVRGDRARLCFINNVVEGNYNALIKEGYLSRYDHHAIPEWTPEQVAAAYMDRPDYWGKTAIFFRTRSECDACVSALAMGGVDAELVTGESDRENQLSRFSSGESKVVVNMSVLTEGFNEPTMETVMVRDTASEPAMIQQAGRVLRLHNGVVKKVVQSTECSHPFTKIAHCTRKYELTKNGVWNEHVVGHKAIEAKLREYRDGAARNLLNVDVRRQKKGFLNKAMK